MEYLPLLDRSGTVREIVPKPIVYERLLTEFRELGEVSHAIAGVDLLLFRSSGEFICVQRGASMENPYLWDKTAGGHVNVASDAPTGEALSEEYFRENMSREVLEELGIALVFHSSKHALLWELIQESVDAMTHGRVFPLDTIPWYPSLLRRKDGIFYAKRTFKTIYVGVYDGPIAFPDGEAQAVRELTLPDLSVDIARNPWPYAYDLIEYVRRYEIQLRDFSEHLRFLSSR